MTRIVSIGLFALGAIVVLWMGASFIESSLLALLVSVLIAAAYTTGFVELLRYQRETQRLAEALEERDAATADLNEWLQRLPSSLRFAVRQRINGEALGLPAPLLTPYLVGLLVMLGLLGTFIGMVETLQGAVSALEGSTELEAVREGLATPIQGLGLAFATSVAGITASAMLGLISTLSRRERLQVSRILDGEMAGVFKAHSLSYQRRETFEVLRSQATALPEAVEQLAALAKHFDERMLQMSESLTQSQRAMHTTLSSQFQALSESVESSLSKGFENTGRVAAESASPVLKQFTDELATQNKHNAEALASVVAQQLKSVNEQLATKNQQLEQSWQAARDSQSESNQALIQSLADQLSDVGQHFDKGAEGLLANIESAEQARLELWQSTLADSAKQLSEASEQLAAQSRESAQSSQGEIATLVGKSDALLEQQMQREDSWQSRADERLQALVASASEQLAALRSEEQARGEAAVARLAELQQSSAEQLSALGASLEAPMTRLMETASDAPKAAAEVIAQLRGEISKNIERDNALLDERQQTLSQMTTLSASLEENARLQREAVESLLQGSNENMAAVAERFESKVSEETAALSEQIADFSASTAEFSAVGELFSTAINQFGDANNQLVSRLEQIETVLLNAGQRSDKQMAYYLSQAREIIDHNLLAQQELLERLQRVGAAAEA